MPFRIISEQPLIALPEVNCLCVQKPPKYSCAGKWRLHYIKTYSTEPHTQFPGALSASRICFFETLDYRASACGITQMCTGHKNGLESYLHPVTYFEGIRFMILALN